jgi:hypothetical protein
MQVAKRKKILDAKPVDEQKIRLYLGITTVAKNAIVPHSSQTKVHFKRSGL